MSESSACPAHSLGPPLSLLWGHVSYAGNGTSTRTPPGAGGSPCPRLPFQTNSASSGSPPNPPSCQEALPPDTWEGHHRGCAQKSTGLESNGSCSSSLWAMDWLGDPRQATEPRFFLWRAELVAKVVVSVDSLCKGPGALRMGSYCWIHKAALNSQPQAPSTLGKMALRRDRRTHSI